MKNIFKYLTKKEPTNEPVISAESKIKIGTDIRTKINGEYIDSELSVWFGDNKVKVLCFYTEDNHSLFTTLKAVDNEINVEIVNYQDGKYYFSSRLKIVSIKTIAADNEPVKLIVKFK